MQKKQFLVVAPAGAGDIISFQKIDQLVYKVIVSDPCPELLERVMEAMQETEIHGILTRGSLAQYLYANQIPVPIFELKYEFYSILELLQSCADQGQYKICIIEIGSCRPGQEPQQQYARFQLGEFLICYSRLYDRAAAEQEIKLRINRGELDVVVGDVEPLMIARQMGLPCRNFIVDENAYWNTLEEADYTTETTLKERAQDRFITIITSLISEAVIITDEAGVIQQRNLQAERFLTQGEPLTRVQELFETEFAQLLQLPANQLIDIRDRRYVLNVIPRDMGEEHIYAFVLSNAKDVENMEMSIRRQNLTRGLTAKYTFHDIVIRDPISVKLRETAMCYAKSNGTIIIYGETGTGKEVIAASIHNESLRANGPFLAINCAAFSENLIESELFGYEKGAFTGASASGKRGLFELAHQGTLFLDEVGELSLSIQAKLLRALQEKEIMRVGGDKIIPVDVRIIAATNKNLREMVRQNTFREDLYYRLALLELELPPLRRRLEDIIPLFTSFLGEASEQEKRAVFWDSPSVFEPILNYSWPGNIRELRNFAERVVLLCKDYRLDREFIAQMMREQKISSSNLEPMFTTKITEDLKSLEYEYLNFLLQYFHGDKDRICSYLHISKTTLWRKLDRNRWSKVGNA